MWNRLDEHKIEQNGAHEKKIEQNEPEQIAVHSHLQRSLKQQRLGIWLCFVAMGIVDVGGVLDETASARITSGALDQTGSNGARGKATAFDDVEGTEPPDSLEMKSRVSEHDDTASIGGVGAPNHIKSGGPEDDAQAFVDGGDTASQDLSAVESAGSTVEDRLVAGVGSVLDQELSAEASGASKKPEAAAFSLQPPFLALRATQQEEGKLLKLEREEQILPILHGVADVFDHLASQHESGKADAMFIRHGLSQANEEMRAKLSYDPHLYEHDGGLGTISGVQSIDLILLVS